MSEEILSLSLLLAIYENVTSEAALGLPAPVSGSGTSCFASSTHFWVHGKLKLSVLCIGFSGGGCERKAVRLGVKG